MIKNNEEPKESKIKIFFIKLFQYIKRPAFFIPFMITYLGLESPIIFGIIMYGITREERYLQIALGWFALTAPALPIPVIPISTAVGIAVERIIKKIKEKKANGRTSNKVE